ncbi:MAG: sarcosine oxidase subunit gamma family protein [Sulfitobacter sp.]
MSEPVTALGGVYNTSGIATVTELKPYGMITLRGDLTDKALIKAATAVGGGAMPGQRQCAMAGERGLAWMSPDELLILCPYAQVHDHLADLRHKLAKRHALAVNVSDARAMFEVSGPNTREVIAKLAPVDMHPDHFAPGDFRRSRIAQVPAAFWLSQDQSARIICFRSVGRYVFDVLNVAAQAGSEVGHF